MNGNMNVRFLFLVVRPCRATSKALARLFLEMGKVDGDAPVLERLYVLPMPGKSFFAPCREGGKVMDGGNGFFRMGQGFGQRPKIKPLEMGPP